VVYWTGPLQVETCQEKIPVLADRNRVGWLPFYGADRNRLDSLLTFSSCNGQSGIPPHSFTYC